MTVEGSEKIGLVAAQMMEIIDDDYEHDIEIGIVAILVEVNGTNPELVDDHDLNPDDEYLAGQFSEVRYRCSDARRWVQIGFFKAAERAVLATD